MKLKVLTLLLFFSWQLRAQVCDCNYVPAQIYWCPPGGNCYWNGLIFEPYSLNLVYPCHWEQWNFAVLNGGTPAFCVGAWSGNSCANGAWKSFKIWTGENLQPNQSVWIHNATNGNVCEGGGAGSCPCITGMYQPPALLPPATTNSTADLYWVFETPATNYQVRFRPASSGLQYAWKSVPATTFSHKQITGLLYNSNYEYEVRAKAPGQAWTTWSAGTFTTQNTPNCAAPIITNLTSTTSSFSLTWSNISAAIGQELFYRQGTSGTFSKIVVPLGTNTHTVSGLTAGASYQFKIRVKCGTVWKVSPIFTTTLPTVLQNSAVGRQQIFAIEQQDELKFETEINVFPNPAKDLATIQFLSENADNARIEIFDASGKLTFSDLWPISSGESVFQIPVADWPKGVFVMKVLVGEKVETRQLVVF